MKKLILIVAIFASMLTTGQTIEELKAYVDNQKISKLEKVGDRWVDFKTLKEFERKTLIDTTVLITEFIPDALNKGLTEKYKVGDTTFIPKTNRHSYRKAFRSNGTVKYQQFTEVWAVVVKEKSKDAILQGWKVKAKTEKLTDAAFVEIQEYILKGKK